MHLYKLQIYFIVLYVEFGGCFFPPGFCKSVLTTALRDFGDGLSSPFLALQF